MPYVVTPSQPSVAALRATLGDSIPPPLPGSNTDLPPSYAQSMYEQSCRIVVEEVANRSTRLLERTGASALPANDLRWQVNPASGVLPREVSLQLQNAMRPGPSAPADVSLFDIGSGLFPAGSPDTPATTAESTQPLAESNASSLWDIGGGLFAASGSASPPDMRRQLKHVEKEVTRLEKKKNALDKKKAERELEYVKQNEKLNEKVRSLEQIFQRLSTQLAS